GYDLHALGWHSPEALHLIAEAMRRGFADRNQFLGDPDFAPIPPTFLDEAYAARQRATISAERATPSAEIAPGLAAVPAGTHTTHFSVVDGSGNVVALTTTINDSYGSAVTVAGGGFLLNDEMDDFTTKVGAPNMFDLVQGEANAIQPGKRMLSAMTPTIVFDPDGQPLLITGAAGGPRIITTAFQILSNVVDYGMDVATAVSAPRIHHQHLPDILYYEPDGLLPDQIAGLERRGHVVQRRKGTIGVAPSIVRGESGWWGFADPRQGLGTAEGY
ncbi:MAG: gamma-glutamyltransferase, partial [Gemmatimonadetes bacterium]|nr:gamma-glutamyltransferase [Gemmatimonadota bacterium]